MINLTFEGRMPEIFFICLMLLPTAVYAGSKVQLRYEKISEKLSTGLNKFDCIGTLGAPEILKDLGIDDDELKRGVHCRKADFDGNGSEDYWFYKCDQNLLSCRSDVLLMKEDQIQTKVHLSHSLENPEILRAKDKRDHNYLVQFGCARPSEDSIVEEGDGDGKMNRIYVLNKDRTDFIESSHCRTVEAE